MRHFALHFSKYIGYFVQAIDQSNPDLYRKALIDSFIIDLAAANTLNLNLGAVACEVRENMPSDIRELGTLLEHEFGRPHDERIWIVKLLAVQASRLAKACESLDHVDAYPFRSVMEDSIVQIFRLVVAEASHQQVDLLHSSRQRHSDVGSKNLFNKDHTHQV
jgi:hypothetical protein